MSLRNGTKHMQKLNNKKSVIFILIQPLPHKNSLKKNQSFNLMGTTLSLCLKPFKSQSTVLTDFQSLTTEGWEMQCIHIPTLSPETTGNVGDDSLAPSPDLISESFSTLCSRKLPHAWVLSRVRLFATLWTIGYQVPLSMEFSRQEYWSGLPFPTPGDLPHPGMDPAYPGSPALAGGFFTT